MTHTAMSSIRVMATCTLLGEAVGKAAAIATENSCAPHDVFLSHLSELQKRLMREDSFLPSKRREISEVCKNAKLNVACDYLRNGEDRAHRIYNTESGVYCTVSCGTPIEYSFQKENINRVHIVFDSDLNRETLPGGRVESRHITRANVRLDAPVMHMPKTLCREFTLIGEKDGERVELLKVENNRKRAYDIKIEKELDKLILIPESTWGESCAVSVISFDFE